MIIVDWNTLQTLAIIAMGVVMLLHLNEHKKEDEKKEGK